MPNYENLYGYGYGWDPYAASNPPGWGDPYAAYPGSYIPSQPPTELLGPYAPSNPPARPVGPYAPSNPPARPVGPYAPSNPPARPVGPYAASNPPARPVGSYAPSNPPARPVGSYVPSNPPAQRPCDQRYSDYYDRYDRGDDAIHVTYASPAPALRGHTSYSHSTSLGRFGHRIRHGRN